MHMMAEPKSGKEVAAREKAVAASALGSRAITNKRDRATERGDMMRYFLDKINRARVGDGLPAITMGRMGRLLLATPTKDLYYLKSICDQAPNFSKKFWWEIDPKKHTPEEEKKRAALFEKKNAERFAKRFGTRVEERPATAPRPLRPTPPATRVSPRAPRSLG